MPWHVILACESQEFELLWETTLLHLDIRVIKATLRLLLGLTLATGLTILLL
jgi:hypothetical protein